MLQSQIAAGMVTGAGYASYSLMVAALALMFQECMKPAMLFARYRLLLLYLWRKNWRKKDRWKRTVYLLQPLGLCIYCNSAWMSISYYLITYGIKLDVLLFMGMTFLWVKLFVKFGLK